MMSSSTVPQIADKTVTGSGADTSAREGRRLLAPVQVVCLGAGYFARFHHDAWQRLDQVALVGIADSNSARAHDASLEITRAQKTRSKISPAEQAGSDTQGTQSPGVEAFNSLEAMLDKLSPQLLDIITPPHTHLESINAGINAGVTAIICQKPFCQSLHEARQAVELAKAADVVLVVHENFRFQPWYRAIAEQLNKGTLGEVQQVTFRLRPGDGQGTDAYLDRQPYFQTMSRLLIHETAVHWIDTFAYLLGPIEAVYADLRRLNPVIAGEDAGHVLFDFANGVRALFDGNRHLDHATHDPRLTLGEALIEGTTGTLSLNGDGSVCHRSFGQTDSTIVLAARDWAGFGGDCVHALQQHVINALTHGSTLENEAREYLRVMEIETAIYQSAEQERKIRS